MDSLTIVLASLGGITITGAVGLLFKHLTIDHNKIEADLKEIKALIKEKR